MKRELPVEWLRQNLTYDPLIGKLFWIKAGRKRNLGAPLGWLHEGYVEVSLCGKGYKAHRVIVALVTGVWPKDEVDHKDLNRANNIWENIRDATKTQNVQNKPLYKNSTSGLKGVTWHKKEHKWRAQIQVNKKKIVLGRFPTPEKAHAAYVAAAKKHFGEFARVR